MEQCPIEEGPDYTEDEYYGYPEGTVDSIRRGTMNKERPIIFTEESVRQILAGNKTQSPFMWSIEFKLVQ